MYVSCKYLTIIIKAIVKVIVLGRTKRGKALFELRFKGAPLPLFLGQGRHYTWAQRLLVGQKSRSNSRP